MDELKNLLRALDEWEAADDRANEAAALLARPGQLTQLEFDEVRSLQRTAALKLEKVRQAVAEDVEPVAC